MQKKMKLFETFSRKYPNKVFISVVLGALAGVFYSFLIPIVLNSFGLDTNDFEIAGDSVVNVLSIEVASYKFAVLYFLSCVFILGARTISQVILMRVSVDVARSLREDIYARIIKAPIADLEKLGPSKLLASITDDVQRIVNGARSLPDLLVNLVTLLGLLSFLLYLNPKVFIFVFAAISFGAITYQIPMLISSKAFGDMRIAYDGLLEGIRGLMYGTKELKLCKVKRDSYFDEILLHSEEEVARSEKKVFTLIRAAANYGDLVSFFVIGSITFVFVNYHAISTAELVAVVMALLYITGPVGLILNLIPQVTMARVALKKVNSVLDAIPDENLNSEVIKVPQWQSLKLNQIVYQYPLEDKTESFQVGPINAEIKKGEITFLVGGNGSGKSTLGKVICLHYLPTGGTLEFDGVKVTKENLESYRQCVSVIYTDYYLFDRLLGSNSQLDAQSIQSYMEQLKIETKLNIEQRKFSTLSLSDGQKKRLALLVSFIEDKEFYVFDEWAADQDPIFKDFFYREILPKLKAKGKAVLVISHDDRYFSMADRLLTMENGQLKKIKETAKADLVEPAL